MESLAQIESDCMLSFGFMFLMYSISQVRQSNFLRHFCAACVHPLSIIQSTINSFIHSRDQAEPQHQIPLDQPIRIVLPFKDQRSANAVRKDLGKLEKKHKKIGSDLHPVVASRKLIDDIKVVEAKPPLTNQHCVFSAECTIRMVWGLTPLKPYGNKAMRCKL